MLTVLSSNPSSNVSSSRFQSPATLFQVLTHPAPSPNPGKPSSSDFSRRSSSGNWAADQATLKEELQYKRTMGFL